MVDKKRHLLRRHSGSPIVNNPSEQSEGIGEPLLSVFLPMYVTDLFLQHLSQFPVLRLDGQQLVLVQQVPAPLPVLFLK